MANSRPLQKIRRWLFKRLPFPVLESDIVDVVYANWVVEVSCLTPLIRSDIKLWQKDGKTVITTLTYKHGHFGPAIANLRALFSSPLQSNWRFYIDTIRGVSLKNKTVLFIKNITDNAFYAVGSRLFSDVMPGHLPKNFKHVKSGGLYETSIEAGTGSSPDFYLKAHIVEERVLPEAFKSLYGSWSEAVEHLFLQDSAAVKIEEPQKFALADIELLIDLSTIVSLKADTSCFESAWLGKWITPEPPLCFLVPRVKLKVLNEEIVHQKLDPHPGLYEKVMGPSFQTLHPSIQRLHDCKGADIQGIFDIEVNHKLSFFLTNILCFPKSQKGIASNLKVESKDGIEWWNRQFGNRSMKSVQHQGSNGRLVERMGPLQVEFELTAFKGGIRFKQKAVHGCIGGLLLPIPKPLRPKIEAVEYPKDDLGCIVVSVTIASGFLGTLLKYEGELRGVLA